MTTADLLKPSLDPGTDVPTPIFSTTAGFLTAFLGGPFATLALTTVNSWRLRRLRQEALPLLAGFLFAVAAVVAIHRPGLLGFAGDGMTVSEGRMPVRLVAFALFGGGYVLHRRYHRSMQVVGIPAPNPWLPAIACIAAGIAAMAALYWGILT